MYLQINAIREKKEREREREKEKEQEDQLLGIFRL